MSETSRWYAKKSVLVTGSTGFMGKVLVEKLLRCCPDLTVIYLLIRHKKGKTPEERLEDYFDQMVFDKLRETSSGDFRRKIKVVPGDVQEANLNLQESDYSELKERVDVVFHMAANVRFDLDLKTAVRINTCGTRNVLEVAKRFRNLRAFVHVSTTFCHCDRDVLDEQLYPAPHHPRAIIELTDLLGDEDLKKLTPYFLKKYPNTYAYTKCLTEHLIKEYSESIPIVVVRPSIVIAALSEPSPGWIDNLNGPTGILVGAGKGIIRSMHCNPEYNADVVPVDVTVNRILLATRDFVEKRYDKEPQVYNIGCDTENPITWGKAIEIGRERFYDNPFSICLWYPDGSIKSSYFLHMLSVFFFHYVPAYLIDFVLPMVGQKPFLVNVQRRISTGLEILQYYTTKNWVFKHDKIKKIERELSEKDKKVFFSDMSRMDWGEYILTYVLGMRKYCMKEGPETLPRARKLLKRLYLLDLSVKLLLVLILIYYVYNRYFS